MCERIAQRRSAQALAGAYRGLVLTDDAPLPESEEIAPCEGLAVVHGNAAGAPRLGATRWGASTPGTYRARPMTLARAESAATKRSSGTRRATAAPSCPAKAGRSGDAEATRAWSRSATWPDRPEASAR